MRRIFLFLFILLAFPRALFAAPLPLPFESTVVTRVPLHEKVVALTFDADMTPYMLKELRTHKVASWYNTDVIKELERAHVPATLFLTGMWIETYATATRALSENPLFELGNHSYSHGGFTSHCYGLRPVSDQTDVAEISKTDALLALHASHYSKLFRFPGLCHDSTDVAVAHSLGYSVIDGDVYGSDGFEKHASVITKHVLKKVRSGSIVVLHMHGGPNAPETAVALPAIIKKLQADGYTFLTVSDLLHRTNSCTVPAT